MGMTSWFRRTRTREENEAMHGVHSPWWAWGPLGLIWYGSHGSSHDVDAGHLNHPGDAGHFNHNMDHGHNMDQGGGFGGFDGGAGGV